MKAQPSTIASVLGAPGPFYRSVSIERDRHDGTAMRNYVLTPWLERVATEILEGLAAGSRRRAWRITGDFGVGKSALALALLRALDPASADRQAPLDRLAAKLGRTMPRMLPLVLTGSSQGLATSLSEAIKMTVAEKPELIDAKARKAILGADPFRSVLALHKALAKGPHYDGLLIVIDEMGKFLEQAADDPHAADIHRLQDLAEAAARSGDRPLALMLILHQGLQSYSEKSPIAMRSEWAKVAERYDEIVFDHPLSHTAALVVEALNVAPKRLPSNVAKEYDRVAGAVDVLGWQGPRVQGTAPCYPLHPAAVPVLARFFSAYGQNERSLFGFLASEEANGLRAFASQTEIGEGFYGLEHFFDYVATSFGHRLIAKGGTGDWERIRSVLAGAAELPELETVIVKIIGILNLIDAPDMAATLASIQACLMPRYAAREVEVAVERLSRDATIFERVGRAGYRLWSSHRVDLSLLWREADEAVPEGAIDDGLAKLLSTIPIKPFLLARRHSIETGVTRRFPIRLLPASALATANLADDVDGSLLAILSDSKADYDTAKAWATIASRDETKLIVLVPAPITALRNSALDLLRHRWIEANSAILREDAHALAEIERRITELEGRLVDAIEAMLGVAGHAPSGELAIFRAGKAVGDHHPAHILVSDLCDDLYRESPLVQNELINRHHITSAGAGARQRLIEAMFARNGEALLGFNDRQNPPEKALYLSIFSRGKIHVETSSGWQLAVPAENEDPLRLRPSLQAIETLMIAGGVRVTLTDIYATLGGQPYGVRAGLAPLLFAVILVGNLHRIALFERGTYCPKVDGQAFMRILKAPEHFTVQWIELEGIRKDVYRRLKTMIGNGKTPDGLMSVVEPLARFGASLNFHAQKTNAVSPTAIAVRDALLRSRSPLELLFRELPLACGTDTFAHGGKADGSRVAAFTECLEAAVGELQSAYPQLLEAMRRRLGKALNATDNMRLQLQARVQPLVFKIREQSLKTFSQRIADPVLGDDAWIEAIGGALLSKPPSRWSDQDVALWESRLEEHAGAFTRVEAANFGTTENHSRAVRIALTLPNGDEHFSVVGFDPLDKVQDRFAKALFKQIEGHVAPTEQIFARLAQMLIDKGDLKLDTQGDVELTPSSKTARDE